MLLSCSDGNRNPPLTWLHTKHKRQLLLNVLKGCSTVRHEKAVDTGDSTTGLTANIFVGDISYHGAKTREVCDLLNQQVETFYGKRKHPNHVRLTSMMQGSRGNSTEH